MAKATKPFTGKVNAAKSKSGRGPVHGGKNKRKNEFRSMNRAIDTGSKDSH